MIQLPSNLMEVALQSEKMLDMDKNDQVQNPLKNLYSPGNPLNELSKVPAPSINLDGLSTMGKIGVGAGGLYGARHGIRYATPILQQIAYPMQMASTRIEGYYNPKTVAEAGRVFGMNLGNKFGKVRLTVDHYLAGGTPGTDAYIDVLKKNINRLKDPQLEKWIKQAETNPLMRQSLRDNIDRFLKSPKANLYGLGTAGVRTPNELFEAQKLELAEEKLVKAQDLYEEKLNQAKLRAKKTGKDIVMPDDSEVRKYKKEAGKARNMLRYEMQKTELIKHSFGKKIDKTRWKVSGLGDMKTTTLEKALDGNTRAVRAWINDSRLFSLPKSVRKGNFLDKLGSTIAKDTKVTVSQYKGQDARTLITGAKNYGSTYLKQEIDLAETLGMERPMKRIRVGGIFDLTKDAHRLYEKGIAEGLDKDAAFKKYVAPYLDNVKKNVTGNQNTVRKATEMIDKLKANVDHVDGRTKVNYDFVSNQQTVAGVNGDIEVWRGKGTVGAKSAGRKTIWDLVAEVTEKPTKNVPGGKLHHSILVSDLYDVAGGAGSLTQKNLHMNVAKSTSKLGRYGSDIDFGRFANTRKSVLEAAKQGDWRKITQLLPKLGKKGALRLIKLIAMRR